MRKPGRESHLPAGLRGICGLTCGATRRARLCREGDRLLDRTPSVVEIPSPIDRVSAVQNAAVSPPKSRNSSTGTTQVEQIVICVEHGYALDRVTIRTIYGDEASHIKPLQNVFHLVRVVFASRRRSGRIARA